MNVPAERVDAGGSHPTHNPHLPGILEFDEARSSLSSLLRGSKDSCDEEAEDGHESDEPTAVLERLGIIEFASIVRIAPAANASPFVPWCGTESASANPSAAVKAQTSVRALHIHTICLSLWPAVRVEELAAAVAALREVEAELNGAAQEPVFAEAAAWPYALTVGRVGGACGRRRRPRSFAASIRQGFGSEVEPAEVRALSWRNLDCGWFE